VQSSCYWELGHSITSAVDYVQVLINPIPRAMAGGDLSGMEY
jgi:hypothetical protein